MKEQPSLDRFSMKKKQKGYIALTTILIISAIILILGTSVTSISINEIQSSFSSFKNEEALDFVETCVEDALMRLNKNNSIPSTITLPAGSCFVTINSHIDSTWTFTVSGGLNNHTKRIQITANRTTSVQLSSWKEI